MSNNNKTVRILSLDGGGIRGIIPATIVQYAEEYLQAKAPGTTIADHFDLIAGTSTGGILAGIYLAPEKRSSQKARYTASDALNFYLDEGYNIFNESKIGNVRRLWGLASATQYNPKYLERLLRKNLGDLQMHELIKPCLITTYNMVTKSSFFFTSREDISKRAFYVRDALLSTSAAPTYFPPANVQNLAPNPYKGESSMVNLDGGVFANNPALCAYAEARDTNFEDREIDRPSASNMYVLSLGTGGGEFELDDLEKSAKWGLTQWASYIPDIMMDGSVDTVSYQMKEIFGTLNSDDPGDYMRVDTPLEYKDYSPDLADASDENIQKLQEAAAKTLDLAKENGLNKFLDGLLNKPSLEEVQEVAQVEVSGVKA